MHQALHIFKKDVRYLRHEIALILLIAITFAAMHAAGPRHISIPEWAELALIGGCGVSHRPSRAGRGHPRRSPVLDYASLSLAKPARRKTPVHCRFRELAHFGGASVHPDPGRLPARLQPSRPALVAGPAVLCVVAALCRAGLAQLQHGFVHLFPIDRARRRVRHLGTLGAHQYGAPERSVMGTLFDRAPGLGSHRDSSDFDSIQDPPHAFQPWMRAGRNRTGRWCVRRFAVAGRVSPADALFQRARPRILHTDRTQPYISRNNSGSPRRIRKSRCTFQSRCKGFPREPKF